ncbi:MAG TPA: P-II family nitrogen regulator [Blastocatellia bacterium]
MRIITAMIQPFMLNKVASALETVEDFPGMTVSDALGLCRKRAMREQRKPHPDGFKGKVFIEIVTPDEKAQQIIETFVRSARTNTSGDGKIFVVPVDSAVCAQPAEFDNRRPDALLTLLIFNDFRVFQLASNR